MARTKAEPVRILSTRAVNVPPRQMPWNAPTPIVLNVPDPHDPEGPVRRHVLAPEAPMPEPDPVFPDLRCEVHGVGFWPVFLLEDAPVCPACAAEALREGAVLDDVERATEHVQDLKKKVGLFLNQAPARDYMEPVSIAQSAERVDRAVRCMRAWSGGGFSPFLTTAEVADLYRISEDSVLRLAGTSLPRASFRVGRQYRFDAAAILSHAFRLLKQEERIVVDRLLNEAEAEAAA